MATVTADSYGIDNTGATDITAALATAINAQPAGTIFQLHADGSYKSDAQKIWSNSNGITIDGQNAAIFESIRRTGVPTTSNPTFGTVKTLSIVGANMTVRNLRLYGFRKDVYPGTYLVAAAGSPTKVGSTWVLDAQGEEVRLPQTPLDMVVSIEYETPFYFRDKDGYVRFEFSASDTTHVANDAVLSIVDDVTGTVLASQAFTLTGTAATYQLAWLLPVGNLGTRLRITVKKATATANTITVASITPYGEAGYRPYNWFGNATNPAFSGGDEFSYHFAATGNGCIVQDCYSEGPDGDGVNFGVSNNVQVLNVTTRCANRQGMVMQKNTGTIVDGFTAREIGRAGIDLEPNPGDTVHDPIIRNCTFINCRNYAIASGLPTQTFNLSMSNITSTNIGMGPFAGGAIGGSISNWVHSNTYRSDTSRVNNGGLANADALLYWQGLECDDFTTDIGFALQNKGSTIYRDMHLRGAIITNPRTPSYRTFLDTMGVTSTGQAWRDDLGNWNVDNGRAYMLCTTVSNNVTSVETGMANVVVEADITMGASGSNGGLIFRSSDATNYQLMHMVAPATLNLYQRVAGTFTLIGTATLATFTNSTVHLKVVANGSTLQFYTAGVLRSTITNSANISATRCGLLSSNLTVLFDNFSVVAA